MANLALQSPTLRIYPHQNLAQAATDELGKLQATIAPLRNREEALKNLLRDCGEAVVEGDLFRCTVSAAKASQSIDFETLAREYIPADLLAKLIPCYTVVKEPGKPRVTISARKGV